MRYRFYAGRMMTGFGLEGFLTGWVDPFGCGAEDDFTMFGATEDAEDSSERFDVPTDVSLSASESSSVLSVSDLGR